VILHLSDQGIGILPTEKPWLFNPFFRGSNIGVTPGVGLGLVIVKECVDLHGGEILVESEVGQGTMFTVTLPIRPPSQE
jgi:signal transduction histidine kinase